MGVAKHTIGLKSGGTVVAVGNNGYDQLNVSSWTGIVAVAAGNSHTVGLKSDGTVVAVGNNSDGQLNVSSWTGIVAVAAGESHTVGLKSDGTVVAVGKNGYGQLNVSSWTGIVAVAAGDSHTVGLKSDGTVVAVGNNSDGQLNVSSWTGIVAVAAGGKHTVGLKSDGTVVAVGANGYGQLNVSSWTGIVAVAAGRSHTVGLKSDGTVVAIGDNGYGQLNVSSWTGIVAVAAGGSHTVGLKSDGTVVAIGDNSDGQLNVSSWTGIVALWDSSKIYSLDKKGLLISTQSLNLSNFTSVSGFTITGNQPNNTDRRLVFSHLTPVLGSIQYTISTNAVSNDTVSIGGVTFTATASTQDSTHFIVGTDTTATATNLKTSLNANSTINTNYLAFSSTNVITLTEKIAKGNTPTAATKTGTIVIASSTAITSVQQWYKLSITSGTATPVALTTQAVTIASVLSEGNTVAELKTITSIPAFAGKQLYIGAALFSAYGNTLQVTLGIAINGQSNQYQYTHDEYSSEYVLGDTDVNIVSISANTTVTGTATAVITVSLKQNGTWSSYMPLTSAQAQKASAVKYKATYTVSVIGGADTAIVNNVSIIYTTGSNIVSGGTTDIITITQDYENGLSYAQCLVKHKKLIDAQIKAYVSFRSAPNKRDYINVATANGSLQTVTLGINGVPDTNINQNTLVVRFNNNLTYDYSYNTETGQLTFTADNGTVVTASYEYGWEQETWNEMIAQTTQIYNDTGYYATKFTYTIPSNVTAKPISNVKVQLYRPTGSVTNVPLGTATGNTQLFVLPHYAKEETISCTGAWSYDSSSKVLTVIATNGTSIVISYDWIAEMQEVYGITAGWAE